MSDQEKQEDEFLDRAAAALAEHWDTVQIFVSRHEPETDERATLGLAVGRGNTFAREAQVRNWLTRKDEYAREQIRNGADS